MPAIISCRTTSYGPFGERAAIENVARAGLEYVDLRIHTAGVPAQFDDEPLVTTESTPAELEQVDRLLETAGLRVAGCEVDGEGPLDRHAVETIKRKLDVASHFGVGTVVGPAGEADDEQSRATLYRHLGEIGDHAAERGITYCLETGPGLCRDHYGMRETTAALDHPHVRLSFDTAAIYYYNEKIEGEVALAKVCHLVRHVRLKDSMGEYGRWYFPALGSGGAVDFVRVLELTRTCGFVGPYSIDVAGIAGEGALTLEEYHGRVVDSVEQLRRCGYFD